MDKVVILFFFCVCLLILCIGGFFSSVISFSKHRSRNQEVFTVFGRFSFFGLRLLNEFNFAFETKAKTKKTHKQQKINTKKKLVLDFSILTLRFRNLGYWVARFSLDLASMVYRTAFCNENIFHFILRWDIK